MMMMMIRPSMIPRENGVLQLITLIGLTFQLLSRVISKDDIPAIIALPGYDGGRDPGGRAAELHGAALGRCCLRSVVIRDVRRDHHGEVTHLVRQKIN